MLEPPFDAGRDHHRGEAGRVLLMFGDYECPYTRRAYRELGQLDGERFVFAYRHLPLGEIHPHANGAALAAEGVAAQGLFWPYHDVLFHRQKALTVPDLLAYAGEIGADVERLMEDMREGRHAERVLEDVRSAVASEAQGTPTLFVDGARHDGGYDAGELAAALGL